MSVENEVDVDEGNVTGHVVAAKRRYRRAKDEEKELKELIEARKIQDGDSSEDEEDENLDAEEATFKKRYGDLRRHTQNLQSEHRKEMQKLEKRMSQMEGGKKFSLPKTEAEIANWSKKYPDVAKMMESIALKKSGEVSESIKKEMEGLQEMKRTVSRDKAEAELLQLHPDFVTIKKDPVFHEWAGVQPKWVQDALYENEDNALACAKAITLYKAETKQLSPSRNNASDAARKVKTRSGTRVNMDASSKGKFKESQVQAMSASEYEKNEDAISASIQNGSFIYDISGAAR
jgi:hypothetical protein|tara:strand:+ start:2617 stop:3486 length:870 start_codon:yes stop_codon:yes gene_type:complete